MIFQIALKNLFLHGKRHFLTSLGLFAGLLGIILFGGYVLRMEDYLSTHAIYLKNAGHISIYKNQALDKYLQSPAMYSISIEEQNKVLNILNTIKGSLDVERVIMSGSTQAMLTNGCQSFPIYVQGLEPKDQEWITQHPKVLQQIPELVKMSQGIDFHKSENELAANISPTLWSFFNKIPFSEAKSSSNEVTTYSDSTNCDTFSKDFQVYTQDFWGGLGIIDTSVVGLKYSGFSFNDEVFLLMKQKQFQNLVKSDSVYKISIFFIEDSDISTKFQLIQKKLIENQLQDLEIHTFKEAVISPIYRGSMNFVTILLIFFVILICGVVALTIANSIQVAFIERKKDISVYKSIGFRNTVITKIFQWEYFLLSLITSFFSLFLSYFIIKYINSLNIRFQLPGYSSTLQFLLNPSFSYLIGSVLLIIAMVVLSTWWQLHLLLKKQSIELMRFDS